MLGRHSKLEHNGTNSIFHKQKRRQTERYKHTRKTVRKRDREMGERKRQILKRKEGER